MPEAKSYFGLITTDAAVFVLGGVTDYYQGSEVEFTLSDAVSLFDLKTRMWTPLPTLPMPLYGIQGVYRGGSLWVLATTRDKNNSAIACYDRQCVLEYHVTQQRWVAHHNTPDVGTPGLAVYTFPL